MEEARRGHPVGTPLESAQDSSRPLTEHACTQRNDNDKHRESAVVGGLASHTPPLAQGEALIALFPGV